MTKTVSEMSAAEIAAELRARNQAMGDNLLLELANWLSPEPVGAPKRPQCFEFAMDFLGDPEAAEIRAYIEVLERAATKSD